MNILVTAGNTLVPIDRVRCITNIFSGRTGAAIALEAHKRGHNVNLLTSHPESVSDLPGSAEIKTSPRWSLHSYQTFDQLANLMARLVSAHGLDAVIHCAAVSDYRAAGIYSPAPGSRFEPDSGHWINDLRGPPALLDRAAGKVKSAEPELWLRLVRTPKLVDQIRKDWNFRGLLVKFKLEVGVPDDRLLEIAELSRIQSAADLMVANTLEGTSSWAYLGPLESGYQRISRRELAERLLAVLESKFKERQHG